MMDLLKFRVFKLIVIIVLGGLFNSCEEVFVENRQTGSALGTTYSILFYDTQARNFETEIDSVFTAINHSMSTYIPDSDISKINAGDSSVVVDVMFQEVFNLSKDINARTEGYFDPTVGVLVNSWGFGPGKQIELDSTRVDSLLHFVGFGKVRLNEDATISKMNPNIVFDFNAIAKGYAVDRLGALLKAKGISNYLVEVGGELVAKGKNLVKNKDFVVGIDDPQANDRSTPIAKINLRNKGLASSGNYRHFRADPISGVKYVHTVDPITGYTKNSNVLGVTILGSTCAEADAYATAFMAMDLEKSTSLILDKKDLEALIVYIDGNGAVKQFRTKGFDNVMVK
ncbi:ApbE family lipoprotein [Cellulophaga algicola DSM 14237]|uniref:FAD:protein FMN transferase n=1 Tax=Cellulophaga algicola (strain DSM 14237 / IC166 / ACAM 630) TaxID=688270 RepID=E6X6M1_CELAD|nr:FAD:protein FMN transferase [Cellulophaga algicola]ADV49559.1 ApbE family lipoprotein [Cellulophaga algicola DSM 14237]